MASATDALRELLDRVVAPLIEADEGELWLVRADQEVVHLHLAGRFSGCPGNSLMARHIVEPVVHTIAPEAVLEISSGPIFPSGAERLGPSAEDDSPVTELD